MQLNQHSANAYNVSAACDPVPPRTLATARSSVSTLNERLAETLTTAENLASLIGGPRPVSASAKAVGLPNSGLIAGLNDDVDHGHRLLAEIRDVLDSIGRQLT